MIPESMGKIAELLPKYHAVCIGPGLSRSPTAMKCANLIIQQVMSLDIPLVIDADALHVISGFENQIKGYKKAVLTPNANEFKVICRNIVRGNHVIHSMVYL